MPGTNILPLSTTHWYRETVAQYHTFPTALRSLVLKLDLAAGTGPLVPLVEAGTDNSTSTEAVSFDSSKPEPRYGVAIWY